MVRGHFDPANSKVKYASFESMLSALALFNEK